MHDVFFYWFEVVYQNIRYEACWWKQKIFMISVWNGVKNAVIDKYLSYLKIVICEN